MIFIYSLLALFIAWIWVDYYRLIDIFDKNKLLYVIIAFVLGCLSVNVVFFVHDYLPWLVPMELTGGYLNDFFFFTLEVGMLEEVAKLIPFALMLLLFKKQFREPIDYVAFVSINALGFSAVENVLYFNNHGASIIDGRAILSSVGHMFDTVLVAYGIILYKFHPRHNSVWFIPLFFVLAALAHGFYDFWLMLDGLWIVTILYFFISISWFAQIVNNALNNSSYFTYKKVVMPNKVAMRLLAYYGIVLALQTILIGIEEKSGTVAAWFLVSSLYTNGVIIAVTCIRLSRIKLINGRWYPFKVEFPFSISLGGDGLSGFRLAIKGDGYDEAMIAPYFQEYASLYPMNKKKTRFKKIKNLVYIEEIGFLKNDEVFYLMRVYESDGYSRFKTFVIKPKNTGDNFVQDKYPIVAIFDKEHLSDWNNSNYSVNNFKFREWSYLVPIRTN